MNLCKIKENSKKHLHSHFLDKRHYKIYCDIKFKGRFKEFKKIKTISIVYIRLGICPCHIENFILCNILFIKEEVKSRESTSV